MKRRPFHAEGGLRKLSSQVSSTQTRHGTDQLFKSQRTRAHTFGHKLGTRSTQRLAVAMRTREAVCSSAVATTFVQECLRNDLHFPGSARRVSLPELHTVKSSKRTSIRNRFVGALFCLREKKKRLQCVPSPGSRRKSRNRSRRLRAGRREPLFLLPLLIRSGAEAKTSRNRARQVKRGFPQPPVTPPCVCASLGTHTRRPLTTSCG